MGFSAYIFRWFALIGFFSITGVSFRLWLIIGEVRNAWDELDSTSRISLNGYLITEKIRQIVVNMDAYSIALRCIEIWAKNISVMVAHLFFFILPQILSKFWWQCRQNPVRNHGWIWHHVQQNEIHSKLRKKRVPKLYRLLPCPIQKSLLVKWLVKA